MDLYCNFPPLPILGVEVEDVPGMENRVRISWEPNGEDDLAWYSIYRCDSDEEPAIDTAWDRIYNVSAACFTDMNVTDGERYWYRIIAVDMDG